MLRVARAAIAVAVAALPAAALGERAPLAILWLDGPHDLASATATALEGSRALRPLDDPSLRALLTDGGPESQARVLLERARERFGAQRCDEAAPLAAQAVAIALADVAAVRARALVESGWSTELACADLARDEAAARAAAAHLAAIGAGANGPLAARYPAPPPSVRDAVRVESDPPGATVYLDLRAIGATPLDLPSPRRGGAIVDVELAGHRKVHRVAPGAGTLAVALAREDRPGALVDAIREAHGDADVEMVAELGRRAGAARVLVARREPGSATRVQARLLDVSTRSWLRPAIAVESGDPQHLLRYAALESEAVGGGKPSAAPVAQVAKPAAPVPAWKRWYTWVAGGVLAALVVGLVVADHVGSDSLTIKVSR